MNTNLLAEAFKPTRSTSVYDLLQCIRVTSAEDSLFKFIQVKNCRAIILSFTPEIMKVHIGLLGETYVKDIFCPCLIGINDNWYLVVGVMKNREPMTEYMFNILEGTWKKYDEKNPKGVEMNFEPEKTPFSFLQTKKTDV